LTAGWTLVGRLILRGVYAAHTAIFEATLARGATTSRRQRGHYSDRFPKRIVALAEVDRNYRPLFRQKDLEPLNRDASRERG